MMFVSGNLSHPRLVICSVAAVATLSLTFTRPSHAHISSFVPSASASRTHTRRTSGQQDGVDSRHHCFKAQQQGAPKRKKVLWWVCSEFGAVRWIRRRARVCVGNTAECNATWHFLALLHCATRLSLPSPQAAASRCI